MTDWVGKNHVLHVKQWQRGACLWLLCLWVLALWVHDLQLFLRGFHARGLAHPAHWTSGVGPVFERRVSSVKQADIWKSLKVVGIGFPLDNTEMGLLKLAFFGGGGGVCCRYGNVKSSKFAAYRLLKVCIIALSLLQFFFNSQRITMRWVWRKSFCSSNISDL